MAQDSQKDQAEKPEPPGPETSPQEPVKDEPAKEESTKQSPPQTGGGEKAKKIDSKVVAEAEEQYATLLKQWRETIKDLQDHKLRFSAADENEVEGKRKRWDELIQQGNDLIPPLREAAKVVYQARPNEDRQLTRLLASFAGDAMERDQYEIAGEVAQVLVENDARIPILYAIAGRAAFANHRFEEAKKFLQEAKASNYIKSQGEEFLDSVDDYIEYWKTEKKLREQEAKKDDLPRVRITTNKGEIEVELFEDQAPGTVGNFIDLVKSGFYNGLTFHRVIGNFMIQGGDPQGDGGGGPGYKIYCETDREDHRKHFRGSLSMAHAGRNTGGSQFFLTYVPTPSLNGRHTVFGRVLKGFDVMAKIQHRNPAEKEDLKIEPDKILKAEVIRDRGHEYKPNKVQ